MVAVAEQRRTERASPEAVLADQALDSAAGALSYAAGVDNVMEMSDAEVGRRLKEKTAAHQQAVADLRAKGLVGRALVQPVIVDFSPKPAKGHRRAPATSRALENDGRSYRRQLVTDGKLISSGDMQKALGFTRQALSAAIKAGRMFTVEVDGQTYYPAFFSEGDVDRMVLEKICRVLGNMPGWMKWDFFTAARSSLGDINPLEALVKGRVADVERLAQADIEEMAR
jgi:hypothetical protein